MKLFRCSNCGNSLFFENDGCLICGTSCGFDPGIMKMRSLNFENNGTVVDIVDQQQFRYCANREYQVCNWVIPVSSSDMFCPACRLNRVIPSLTSPVNRDKWHRIEDAKHRLVYTLLRLGLPVTPKRSLDDRENLAFAFKADTSEERIMTAHADGLITLNIDEADEAVRVKHKLDLGEKYRTLLGHLRHEVGHYYWSVLLKDPAKLAECRSVFGDERDNYNDAIARYYQQGPPLNWNNQYISEYAAAHPWEDWAETWAHYLHMMDTIETAYSFGIAINPRKIPPEAKMNVQIWYNPFSLEDFNAILQMWLPLTFAVNSLNRSMGHTDFYPFIISPVVAEKLAFIHRLCRDHSGRSVQTTAQPAPPLQSM